MERQGVGGGEALVPQSPRVLSTDPNAGEPIRGSGGAPRVQLTADKMAAMSDNEFAATLEKAKKDPPLKRQLFGA